MRLRRRRLVFFFLLALGFSVLLQAQSNLASLEKRVEKLRGLAFEKPVASKIVSAGELKKLIHQEMRREMPPGSWEELETTLKAFRLIPPKMRLKKVVDGLMDEQVAGLYDPHAKTLYVSDLRSGADQDPLFSMLEGSTGLSIQNVFLVHELDHALTDQHFDLLHLPLNDKQNGDRAKAADCVVEGDATWVMLRYLYTELSVPQAQRNQMDDLMMSMTVGKSLMGQVAPDFLEENLLIPYLGGLHFVKAVYEKEGIEGVNALYRRPPASMEQVLHPEKYLNGNDPPVAVSVPEMPAWTRRGWKRTSSGVWGEFDTRLILEAWGLSREKAVKAAEGWGGDAYSVYQSPSGKRGFIWATVWDTLQGAEKFESALRSVASIKVQATGKGVIITSGGPQENDRPQNSRPAGKAETGKTAGLRAVEVDPQDSIRRIEG
jgi:hypothetical protein